jgi:hypothetical protein
MLVQVNLKEEHGQVSAHRVQELALGAGVPIVAALLLVLSKMPRRVRVAAEEVDGRAA